VGVRVDDFNSQARIYCRVTPWEGSVLFGTRDAITALRVLHERNLEYNNKVYSATLMLTAKESF